jgi:16S rRNA (cytidine1402-2'-O)-methyltransferase
VTAALSVCGFEFKQFVFQGFIPRGKKEKEAFYHALMTAETLTHVLYEAPNRIIDSLREIAEKLPDCSVFIINELTKFYEKSYHGGIAEALKQIEAEEKAKLGEYTIVLQKSSFPADKAGVGEGALSLEALLVDEIIKSNCSLKEAIASVSKAGKINKNDVYKASLGLKNLFKED